MKENENKIKMNHSRAREIEAGGSEWEEGRYADRDAMDGQTIHHGANRNVNHITIVT
jgi:hypothetical protein